MRIIVPFPPGGFNDIVARIVATQLSERLGKQFIVDNRTGAGGVVGTEQGAHAPNDGYTLLIASLALTINPWFHKVTLRFEQVVRAGRDPRHRAERDLGPSRPAGQDRQRT